MAALDERHQALRVITRNPHLFDTDPDRRLSVSSVLDRLEYKG